MLPPDVWIYFSTIWSLFSLFLFVGLCKYLKNKTLPIISVLFIILVTLCMRIIPQLLLPVGAGFDIQSFEIVGNTVLAKKDVYTTLETQGRYPYLPFQMYWSAFSVLVAKKIHIPFTIFIKTASIIADATIATFIYIISSRLWNNKIAGINSLLFALNPISILVSVYHGQFDSVPIALVMASIFFISQPVISGVFFGLSILTKSWPILFLPSFIKNNNSLKDRLLFSGVTGLIPLTGIIFYILVFDSSLFNVLKVALTYNHGIGVWGYSYFIKLFANLTNQSGVFSWFIQNSRFITLALLGIIWLRVASAQFLPNNLFTIVLAFLTFTHAFSIQYLSWLIPFSLIANFDSDYKWIFRYTISVFSYMFLAYHTLILQLNITNLLPWSIADHLIIVSGIPAWLICIGWFFDILSQRSIPSPKIG